MKLTLLATAAMLALAYAAHASGPLKDWDDPEVTPPATPYVNPHDPCGPKVHGVISDCDERDESDKPDHDRPDHREPRHRDI